MMRSLVAAGVAIGVAAGAAIGCADDAPSLPRCEDICPMGSANSWVCTRDAQGVERCACPATDQMPEPCTGNL